MQASEEKIPDSPGHNQLFIDDMGLVWRWDEPEEEWVHEFYYFKEMEENTLRRIIMLYKDYIQKKPEEDLGIGDKEYDKGQLLNAVEYLLEKFTINE